jgi:hypothetical protein
MAWISELAYVIIANFMNHRKRYWFVDSIHLGMNDETCKPNKRFIVYNIRYEHPLREKTYV